MTLRGEFQRISSVAYNVWVPPVPCDIVIKAPERDSSGEGLIVEAECEVRIDSGALGPAMRIRHVSPYFRHATIEIDSEDGLEPPLDNGRGQDWATVFGQAGWSVEVETGRIEVPTPAIGGFTLPELHDAMIKSRSASDLDSRWRYHVAAVKHFVGPDAPLGIAFDHEFHDYNGVPREGVAVNAEAELPRQNIYGPFAGKRVRESPEIYFWVAVHEVGHAMGLYHNHLGCGIMETLSGLAERSTPSGLAAEVRLPAFEAGDVLRLRHLPDLFVRPGGLPWETQGLVEDRGDAIEKVAGLFLPKSRGEPRGAFELSLETTASTLPPGAPLRVDLSLRNRSGFACHVPARIGLSTPFVSGCVVGPDGLENEFRSLFKPVNIEGEVRLEDGASLLDSLTLLRGQRGALFQKTGRHTLWVEIGWEHGGEAFRVRSRLDLEVMAPAGRTDTVVARELIRTPETLWYLAVGRAEAFRAGERAIDRALDSGALRAHFGYVKARGVTNPYFGLREDWKTAGKLLEDPANFTWLNRREKVRAAAMKSSAARRGASARASQ